MKKLLSILSVVVLILGLSALSYAVVAEIPSDTTAAVAKGKTQITLGGELQVRGSIGKNTMVTEGTTEKTNWSRFWGTTPSQRGVTKSDSAWGCIGTCSFYDYLVKLNIEAKLSPNTTGFIELVSGDRNNLNYVPFGINEKGTSSGARGAYQAGNTKESTLWISQAWIQYQGSGLLGVPAGIKAGRQPIKLGYGLFLDHSYFNDDAILVFVQPLKELTLAAATIKFAEGNSDYNDDSTAYSLIVAYAGKGWGLGADVTYVDHQNIGNTGGTGLFKDIHLWNIGLRGNVDDIAGTGLGFRADVEFQTGKIDDYSTDPKDVKLKGWAALAGIDYKFKPVPVKLTLEYGIGSGDKSETNNKIEGFITAKGYEKSVIGTFVYDYLTPTACNAVITAGSQDSVKAGLCNTQYVKLGGKADITKDISAELYGYWLRAHKAVAINGATDASGKPVTDKELGWEVDAKITYKIDKGLTYFVEGGYFWPGDAYKVGTLGNLKDADDAWAVRHGLILKF